MTSRVLRHCPGLATLPPALALALFFVAAQATTSYAAPTTLSVTETPSAVLIEWTDLALTRTPPYPHYDTQLETSADLLHWTPVNPLISGGFLPVRERAQSVEIPKTTGAAFYRLVQRLDLAGSSLAGLDLSGADLRGANLADADLTRARLDGADLSGATLDGAKLDGVSLHSARLDDVSLDGLDLTSVDLGEIEGVPRLRRLTADAAGRVKDHLPALNHWARAADFSMNDPDFPGPGVSVRDAVVMLRTNVTVGEFNALLVRQGASVVGGSPGDATLGRGLVVLRFSTRRALELYDLSVRLNEEPIVEVAVPNVLTGPDSITDDSNGSFGSGPNWIWGPAGSAAGGNWGLESSRVPQLWNFNESLLKRAAPRTTTAVIDMGLVPNHEDVHFRLLLGPATSPALDHGMHVAGIIGATFANQLGIDGVNPFPDLIAYEHRPVATDLPNPNLPLGTFEPLRQSWGYRMIEDVRAVLRLAPGTRIINMSLGFNWSQMTPALTQPLSGSLLARVEFITAKYGVIMAAVAAANPAVLIVCSAGNDRGFVPARLSSPMAYAGLQLGLDNIVVVSSHDHGSLAATSNPGGDVLAPGANILSASFGPNGYATYGGTSMASPFVSGLAGYLFSLDPGLSPPEVKTLLQAGSPTVDAFASAMELDLARPWNFMVRHLLDLDDGTRDGNRRVAITTNRLGVDRSFSEVTGPDSLEEDADNDGGLGDGVIDMSDFRRWRDWLLFDQSAHHLDGSHTNLKNDANYDGRVIAGKETDRYPRGDFNGDGVMDRQKPSIVPGWLKSAGAISDLDVFARSGLWSDPNYPDAQLLPLLINTADVTVSAANFFYKYADVPEVEVFAFDATSNVVVQPTRASSFSESNSTHVITVPTGTKYYVASRPMEIGGGTNIQLRSVGELEIPTNYFGADYVVDLTRVEMTSVARVENPAQELVESDPTATNAVIAYLEGRGEAMLTNQPGALASCDREGTLYTQSSGSGLRTGQPPSPTQGTVFSSSVQWQRSFIKDAREPDPEFLVKPMLLRLTGGRTNGIELDASALISLEIRAYDRSPGWEPVFFYRAEIAGPRLDTNGLAAYAIVGQEGDLPPQRLRFHTPNDVSYEQIEYAGSVSLDGIEDGHSFELRYRLTARAVTDNDESATFAYVGDPLHYGSGVRMNYGDFGELPRIREFEIDAQGAAHVRYRSRPDFYYRLHQGTNSAAAASPVAIKLGISGLDELIDPHPPFGATRASYVLENQPLTQPLDFDADGIDDVFELLRPAVLHPLDPTDAAEDPDHDRRTNLAEFLGGTNPELADDALRTVAFPGITLDTLPIPPGVDLNGDGFPDRVKPAFRSVQVDLGGPGGALPTTVSTEVPGAQAIYDLALLDLDGDQRPEVLVVDLLARQLVILRHTTGGALALVTNLPADGDARRIAVGRLDGDALPDVAVLNENSRTIGLFRNEGNGTLSVQPTLRFADFTGVNLSGPDDAVIGDIDQDGLPDLVVAANNEIAVFPGKGSFQFNPPTLNPILSDARRLYATDLAGDQHLDLVAISTTRAELSLLKGPASQGKFAGETRIALGYPASRGQFVDLNADGFVDLVLDHLSAEFHSVLLNDRAGGFAEPRQVATSGGEVVVLDWNGDHHLDLVTPLNVGGGFVALGRGDGTFESRTQVVMPNGSVRQVEIKDLDADGRPELVILNPLSHTLEVWDPAVTNLNGTAGQVRTSVRLPGYVQQFALADANADGRLDAFVTLAKDGPPTNPGTNAVQVLISDGKLGWAPGFSAPLIGRPSQVVTADLNADGFADFALRYLDRLEAWVSNGHGSFAIEPVLPLPGGVQPISAADLNQDRRAELVFLDPSQGGRAFRTWGRSAAGVWAETQALAVPDQLGTFHLIDGDGNSSVDLLTASYSSANRITQVRLYPGTGTGFGESRIIYEAPGVIGVVVPPQDLNGDGLDDWIGTSEIRLAEPAGAFAVGLPFYGGPAGVQRVADLNGDGRPDFISWVTSTGRISILYQK